MPDLKAANVQVVIVVEQAATAAKTVELLGAAAQDVLILMGTDETYNAYQVAGIPANYLVNSAGQLTAVLAGYRETMVSDWLKLVK